MAKTKKQSAVAEPEPNELELARTRLADTRDRVSQLLNEERSVNSEIGASLAEGLNPNGLRERRREIRDEIEDLSASVPFVEARVDELEKAAKEVMDAALFADVRAEAESLIAGAEELDALADAFFEHLTTLMSGFDDFHFGHVRELGLHLPDACRDGRFVRWKILSECRAQRPWATGGYRPLVYGFEQKAPSSVRGRPIAEAYRSALGPYLVRAEHKLVGGGEPNHNEETD